MPARKQIVVFVVMLLVYASIPLLTYLFIPLEQITQGQPMPAQFENMPLWLLGLINSTINLILYGLLGLAGMWLAKRRSLPVIYRAEAGVRGLFLNPMIAGLILGIILTGMDRLFSLGGSWKGFTHPAFPYSIFASISAGIGEEMLFRLFVMSLWFFLLTLLWRTPGQRSTAAWIANGIAALAFVAGHLPAAMMLTNATNPTDIPAVALVELLLLNSTVGLACGYAYLRDGLVAAAGIHFWADVAWHILLPLLTS